jgi:DNA helicase-2/ATP-dependent DNA helicase PcrA
MLTTDQFQEAVRTNIQRFREHWLNPEQHTAVFAPPRPPRFIVAGPGSGKTTVLALRVLKLIFVDSFDPRGVLATTFTRKAAEELRSRVLSWGFQVQEYCREHFAENPQIRARLQTLDINAVLMGTLDSLAEEILRDNRPPRTIRPATIEGLVAMWLMRTEALFPDRRYANHDLHAFIDSITPAVWKTNYMNVTSLAQTCLSFADRVIHDGIDLDGFEALGPGQSILSEVVTAYFHYIEENHYADFARLEHLILTQLQAEQLTAVTNSLQALLVDEFQDTNFLQERIYFELARRSAASFTVVGDDDQSIFRFRGATVELFAEFEARAVQALGPNWRPERVNLHRNYRSSRRIVHFCNEFIQADAQYQLARVAQKPSLIASAVHEDQAPPILGMFRTDSNQLGVDLASFLGAIFRGDGYTVNCHNESYRITRSLDGNFGDSVLLTHSASEFTQDDPTKPRLPIYLRNELHSQFGVPVFNPRGRAISQIPFVERLLGVALECIDPGGTVQAASGRVSPTIIDMLNQWRATGQTYTASNPRPGGLAQFVASWQARTLGPRSGMARWPPEWPFLELIFTLITWVPELQNEPEGQVYLEAITRTISESAQVSGYSGQILRDQGVHDHNSIKNIIRGFFEPMADGLVVVDEDIMPHVPRHYFPVMTIHQAKGLEFPLVIVDVGSRWKTNNWKQQPFRFPREGDGVHLIEDCVATLTAIGQARTQRTALDRAWDDLRRLYYVSYSRPKNVLVMVGLTSQIRNNPVRSIATGDTQNSARHITFVPRAQWHSGLPWNTVALI